MTSPDFTPYIDLTIYDNQPVDIYNAAIDYARTALPEWSPRTGSVEDAILQAGAYMTGVLGGAINRIPNGVIEAILQLLGIQRNTGTAPTGLITITAVDDSGYTIPAGTRFGYLDTSDPNETILYSFETTGQVTIPQGDISVDTVAISGTALLEYPSILAGTALQLLSTVSFIDSATLDSNLTVGADPETDAEYLARGISKLNSYSTALVLPEQMRQYVINTYSSVYRCQAFSRRNPVNDDYNDAEENGYVTIYACKAGGASFTASAASVIAEDVASKSVAGLDITVKAPPIVSVSVAATVTLKSGYTQTTVADNVENALYTYLHPDYWDWSDTIYYNELISLIDRVEGVDRVVDVTITLPTGMHLVDGGPDVQFDKIGALPSVVPTITVQV